MPLSLNLDIVTGDKNIYSGSASMVVVPGTLGELAILPNHANLLTTLSIGELRIFDDNNENSIAIGGGFLQIANNKVIVLADSAERSDEIDYARAQQALERATERIGKGSDTDLNRALISIKKSQARLAISTKKGNRRNKSNYPTN